jgi:Mn2+/Fe2+ NRAMP family transporter
MDRGPDSQNSPGAKVARRAFVLQGRFRRFFSNLGPGLITGAADDDPSGISTYSVTGAAFGYAPLWTALFSFPLMAAVQIMCARLGMVTGLGLAGVIRVHLDTPFGHQLADVLVGDTGDTSARTKRSLLSGNGVL